MTGFVPRLSEQDFAASESLQSVRLFSPSDGPNTSKNRW